MSDLFAEVSTLRWTTKSTRKLAKELTRQRYGICADTAGDVLREECFSLQSNTKTLDRRHPDRDAQFLYLNEQARGRQDGEAPVISVDTKKKELIGPFKNTGREGGQCGSTLTTSPTANLAGQCHTASTTSPRTPAGQRGHRHDTAAFAVESIRHWWNSAGRPACPTAGRLLITADASSFNGYRTRTWKTELAQFSAKSGLTITVCHLPPGTSKWNRIEHRLLSHITMNWRGRPLTSHEVIVESTAATTTKTGLRVHAELDTNPYPTGIQVSDNEITALPITRHHFHGDDWNYTLHPQHPLDAATTDSTSGQAPADRPYGLTRRSLQDPN